MSRSRGRHRSLPGKKEISGAVPGKDARGGWGSRVWLIYLFAGVLATGIYFFVLPGDISQDAFYCLFSASSVAAVFIGLWLYRPERPLVWYMFAVYQVALFAGDLIYQSYLVFLGIEFPFPSIADVFFLSAYLPLIYGLLLMIRRHAPGRDRRSLLDATIVTAGVGVLVWVFLAEPYAEDRSLPLIEHLASVAYLLIALLTFAVLVRLMTTFKQRSAAYRLLCISVLVFVVADMIYGTQSLTGLYEAGGVIDTGWFASYVLIGAAALHPTMRTLSDPSPSPEVRRITWRRLVLLAGVSLLAPLMLLVEETRGEHANVEILAGVSATLSLLVLFRMEGLVRELKATSERYERSAAREEVLRKAGASFVASPTREDVYLSATAAVLELAGDQEVRAYVGTGTPEEVSIVAADGELTMGAEGARFDLRSLPESVRESLMEGRMVEARGPVAAEVRKSTDFEFGACILMSPLVSEEEFMGVLIAATDSPAFQEEMRYGFEALGSQASLALEGARLAERIYRQRDEERFRALIQNSSDIITVVGADGVILYQSPSLEQVLGYRSEEREDIDFFGPDSITHPEDLAKQRDAFIRAIEHPRAVMTTEVRRRHQNGSWRWVQETYTGLLDDPNVGGVVINARDVTERKRSEEKLREAYQRLGFHVENSPVGVIEWDDKLRILRWSKEAERIFGWRAQEVVGRRIDDLNIVHEEDGPDVERRVIRRLLGGERRVVYSNRNYRKDGSVVHCEWYNSALLNEKGELVSVMSLALDVTERKETEEKLLEAEEKYRTLVEQVPVVTYVAGADEPATSIYVSPQIEELLGYSLEEWVEDPSLWSRSLHPEDAARVRAESRRCREAGEPFRMEYRLVDRDGNVVWVRDDATVVHDEYGKPWCWRGVKLDITERKKLEERLEHQALHDPLTDLANRTLFSNRVEHYLSRGDRLAKPLALMLLDLDDFKEVNDSLGHAEGDEVLREVARRLNLCLRSGDTGARLGGDEFAVLIEDVPDLATVARVAERIVEAINAPFYIGESEVRIRGSLGIAIGGTEANADELLRKADVAMYVAKDRTRGGYEFFDPTMNAATVERLALKIDLQKAIERREFVVHYQPVVAIESGATEEVEALVSWEHPERGLIPPGDFIPLAEETGLIVPIGRLVLEEACRQVRTWQVEYPDRPALALSVNLSAREFQRPGLVDDIRETLTKTGLAPECLKLEISESAVMNEVKASLETLRKLKALGVKLAVDDFGTGYSSLAYLKRFPVDCLKIDRSFVTRLEEDPESAAIVATTISMGRVLSFTVTAEGVETADQLARLEELGCDLAQGYYFSKPLPAAAMTRLLTVSAARFALGNRE